RKFLQIIVSPRDLTAVITEAGEPVGDGGERDGRKSAPAVKPRERVVAEPEDEVEKTVAEIWSGLLGLAPIGVHENFLDLGGHSLLAMRIVAQVRTAYQIDFTLRKFFENPTIAGVAFAIREEIVAEIEGLTEEEMSQRVS